MPKNELKQQAGSYFSALEQAGLTDAGLRHPEHSSVGWMFFLVLGALPALIGFMVSWPFRFFARRVVQKSVKKREFVTSVLMGLATVTGVFAGLVLFLYGLFTARPWLLSLVLLAPLLGWFSFFYRDIRLRFAAARKASRHPERAALLQQRAAIK
ncbi:MAG: hypothetical protein IPL27_06995 [Lewinellaceae bacterium]|nr:hypothetical protein [Lewinellaceae bacterium]